MNTSATGGYILSVTPETNDAALTDLLQRWFAGVSGLPGTLVRPLWQEDPPEIPHRSVTWLSIGLRGRQRDWDAFVAHVSGTYGRVPQPGHDFLYRNEVLSVDCVAYGPASEAVCAAVWNNSRIAQNREPLTLAGIAPIDISEPRTLSESVKEKWLYRVNFEVRLRRAVSLRYPVLDVDAATVEVLTDDPALAVTETTDSVLQTAVNSFGGGGFGDAPW